MRINRSHLGGALVALVAIAGLVVAVMPTHSGPGSTGGTPPIVAGAATATLGPLRLTNGYVPQPASDSVAAAYFTIENTSSEPDTLLRVTSSISSSVGLHDETTHGAVSTMTAISSIPVPPGGSFTLSPGHEHLMITNPSKTLKAGDSLDVTLLFAHAGSMTVPLPVVPFSATLGSND